MSDELFPAEQVTMDSPRLAWMKRHGIITYYSAMDPAVWFAGFQRWWPELSGVDFFANETAHNGDSRVGEGETEEEALGELMKCYDARTLKHWSAE